MCKGWGDRFTMSHVNLTTSCTLQHGIWAPSQYFNRRVQTQQKFVSYDTKIEITVEKNTLKTRIYCNWAHITL